MCSALGTDFLTCIVRVNIVIAALDVLLVYLVGKKLWGDNLFATALALTSCVVDNSYTVWSALALEGHFLAFWMLCALLLAHARFRHAGVCLGLVLTLVHMTRPDAGLFNGCMVAALFASWLWSVRQRLPPLERKQRLVFALSALGAWFCTYAVYFTWRYQYYGWLFPNTYYLKVGVGKLDAWGRGFDYLESFFRERHWVPALALFGAFGARSAVARALIIYLVAHTTYILYVGGDFFPGHRFFVAQIPLFGLGLGLFAHWLTTRQAFAQRTLRTRTSVLLGASAIFGYVFVASYKHGRVVGPLAGEIMRWRDEVRANREFMHWLARNKPKGATLATGRIGAAGFFADMPRVIDLLGIIDPVVAHREVENFGRGQAGHEKRAIERDVLRQKPTFLQLGFLKPDFWDDGYYFDARMRPELGEAIEGIWRRDEYMHDARTERTSIIDFGLETQGDFSVEGDAFEGFPTQGQLENQHRIHGQRGYYVNTFSPESGDLATGRLRSAVFPLTGDHMTLRVGGGDARSALRVSLLVAGQTVFSASGLNSEYMSRRDWNIAPYKGQDAALEIVDEATGDWGHLLVDEIEQWSRGRR